MNARDVKILILGLGVACQVMAGPVLGQGVYPPGVFKHQGVYPPRPHDGWAMYPPAGFNSREVYPPGKFSIDGVAMQCGNVVTIVTTGFGDIAKAYPGRIFLDGPRMRGLPTGVKLFIYAHECAHQFVGPNEAAADVWAVRVGRRNGWMTPPILQQICQALWINPGDWTHTPGPMRCRQLWTAYQSP